MLSGLLILSRKGFKKCVGLGIEEMFHKHKKTLLSNRQYNSFSKLYGYNKSL